MGSPGKSLKGKIPVQAPINKKPEKEKEGGGGGGDGLDFCGFF